MDDAVPQDRGSSPPADLVERFDELMFRRAQGPERTLETARRAEAVERAFSHLFSAPPAEGRITLYDPSADHGTVLLVAATDRPFLLSSITAEVRRHGYQIVRSIHPVIGVHRDETGRLTDVAPPREADERESLIYLELRRRLDADERSSLVAALDDVLADVALATRDREAMKERLEDITGALSSGSELQTSTDRPDLRSGEARDLPDADPDEVRQLLAWLLAENFLPLGARDYKVIEHGGRPHVRAVEGSELGVLADGSASTYASPVPLDDVDDRMRSHVLDPSIVRLMRSQRRSTVDRPVRMLDLWISLPPARRPSEKVRRIAGVFTRKAELEPSGSIPVLRRKLERLLELEEVLPESHDERTLLDLFESVPKEELFELSFDDLRATVAELEIAEEERDVRVLQHVDDVTQTVSVIVSLPRDRYEPSLRRAIQDLLLERYDGTSIDVDLSLGDRPDAVVRFAVHARPPVRGVPVLELESEIRRLARTWLDELEAALVRVHGPTAAESLLVDIGQHLPAAYRDHNTVEDAIEDLEEFRSLIDTGDELRVLVREAVDSNPPLRVKILKQGTGIELSAIMPILESIGLTVVEELPFRLRSDDPLLHVHDYGVRATAGPVDAVADGARIASAIIAAWDGRLEVDSLNRVIVTAGLDHEAVGLLRAYRRLRRQVGTAYTADYHNEVLARNPDAVRALLRLFETRFDPDADRSPQGETGATAEETARSEAMEALEAIERLDDDRILHDLLALMQATLRTNRYRTSSPLALKLDSRAIPGVSRPVPYRETFVYSPALEGIHLRGAPIARGGIRWSERRDDFRSEVADLCRAQTLKNAMIVPDGAKGGFILKHPDLSPKKGYERFIRSLLDVTDNVENGAVIPPERVRRLDGDDPYLVVAADRGTATFSDLANAIAAEYDFWLGDAFASGGSNGYDHKSLGITARGAWVAVTEHFRELELDVQVDEISVVGIGDMSGDVFGNGMLQSHTLRLVAAFDHRDIFLDPDPDPERSWHERQRLYELPRSSWADYDRSLISAGGGVWSRELKEIPLSEEVRRTLRLEVETLRPPDLIRAILQAPVDLLFAGGVGTFVKASSQSHDELGDRANAELRIDATELRARVVAEGANLALTPRARIQYARRGGRLNTDFIDNAAGVDISDREVNLKILLRLATQRGLISDAERGPLLAEVTDDIVASCLHDVERQTRLLAHESRESEKVIEAYETLMARLERHLGLDRDAEALPSSDEMHERADAGAGMTRPELAVLLAATKRALSHELTESWVVDAASLRRLLKGYFPRLIADRFDELIDDHRLRRELIATQLASEVVDQMGITYVHRLSREMGITEAEVVAAYWVAREVSGAQRFDEIVRRVELDAGTDTAVTAKRLVDDLLEALARQYARSADLRSIDDLIASDWSACGEVERMIARSGPQRDGVERVAEELVDAGVQPQDAVILARLRDVAIAPDVGRVAAATGRPPAGVASAFLRIDDALGITHLRELLQDPPRTDRWSRWHVSGLLDDLRTVHAQAAERALTETPDVSVNEAIDLFLGRRDAALRHAALLRRQIEDEGGTQHLDAVAVAVRAARTALSSRSSRP